jgi:hypothetical protein
MNKLFDDTIYIDKSVVTDYDKKKWKALFQTYCDSDKIRKESDETGLNACGYWFACDYCDGSDLPCACAKALIQYFIETGRKIDYKNISDEYMDKLLGGNYE